MTTAVATNETFQERMFKRVREQMGDLMTEAELKQIVDTAMHKAFFEEKVIKDGQYWNSPQKTESSQFVKLIQEEMKEPMKKAIQDWLAEHPEKINEVIKEVIGKGFLGIIHDYIQTKTSSPIYEFANQLRNLGILK